jgi:uncharacterized membrane protein YeaQ/YmgE (transglycosylase-associated protein family)
LSYSVDEDERHQPARPSPSSPKEESVDLLVLLIVLVITGICAAFAEWIVGFSPGSLLISVIVGVIGAYLGSFIAWLLSRFIPVPYLLPVRVGTIRFDLLWAFLGSALLLLVLQTVSQSNRNLPRSPV